MKRNTVFLGLGLLIATLTSASISAQQPTVLPVEKLRELQDMTDQVKVALQSGDLDRANRLSSDLMIAIFKQRQALEPTPQAKLAILEQKAPQGGPARSYALPGLATAAFDAEDLDKATAYARELLALAQGIQKDRNYGNEVFYGNMITGRIALRRDKNVILAKSSLLISGQTIGSPELNSFGPNMSLANDLLTIGERETVLEFFALCRKFWKQRPEKLDEWTAMVKGGGIPNFGANLVY